LAANALIRVRAGAGERVNRDVFLSYSSVDKSMAERLCNLLEAAGLTCWIAPRDIKPATDWPTAIKDGIRSSDIFLLLSSSRSLNSREVQREVLLADQEQRPLLTVRIDDSQVPDSLAYFLNRTQWIQWKEGDWASVVDAVFDVLDRPRPASLSSPPLWDSLNRDSLVIVAPRWIEEFEHWERSGAVGYGDARALMELASGTARIGIVNVAIRFHDLLHPDDVDANLILVGGPDANHLSKQFFDVNATTFGWPSSSSHVISLRDERDGVDYHPGVGLDGSLGKDFGLVIRGSNPAHPKKDALLLAGCWGFGTWASARMAFLPQLNAHELVNGTGHFEALVETDVQDDNLWDVNLLDVRGINR
jgi:TIR domain